MAIEALTDDANRQQSVARIFYTFGDLLKGMDDSPRYEPGMVNDSGLVGPGTSGIDIGFGSGGEMYVRGRSGQIGSTSTTTPSGASSSAGKPGFQLTLPAIVVIAVIAWLAFK